MIQVIDKKILQSLPLLEKDEKKSILRMINSYLSLKESQSIQIDIEKYNKEIDEAMKRIDEGNFTIHETVEKESLNW